MRRFGLILIIISLFSCQEEVDLPLATIDRIIPIIEGVWTNDPYYNEVRVSLAKNYLDTTDYQSITDAKVLIRTSDGSSVFDFAYNEGTDSYRTVKSKAVGKIGETYELNVLWGEYEFQSTGFMLEPPIVDSLSYKYEEERLFRDKGYYIKVYGQIPFEDNNYYRIRVIENDTLKDGKNDYLLFDDSFGLKFFNEGLELGYTFDAGDNVRLELFRLNQGPYNYLVQLVNLFFSDGGLFSPPPQNPDSNIKVVKGNVDVLGFFSVSPVLRDRVTIKAEDD